VKLYDAWVQPNPPEVAKASMANPGWRKEVEHLFHRADAVLAGATTEQLVAEMDEYGVAHALLTMSPAGTRITMAPVPNANPDSDEEWCLDAARRFPDRFSIATRINPLLGMTALRQVERYVTDHDVRALRFVPFMLDRPANDKVYYPFYAKCVELGIPVTITVGVPAPAAPVEVANPIYLDEVCRFFPELQIVATHIGFPWHDLLIQLMTKYDNLYLMTSAWAPRHYPQSLIHFINTRGRDKVMFASRWPVIGYDRVVREIPQIGLREEVMEGFLWRNCDRVFKISSAGSDSQVAASSGH
jgi:uncharacterized protein